MIDKEMRILVVDDMATMRKIVSRSLNTLGFRHIVEASDGDDAWRRIHEALDAKKPFGLIVSDWNMPKLKGIELLNRVRRYPPIAHTMFMMVTAEAERDQVSTALQAGVNGYLLKPFTSEQLDEAIKKIFARTKAA